MGGMIVRASVHDRVGTRMGAVMTLTHREVAYLRRVYRCCGTHPGTCAVSRKVAIAIGATENERMDIEDALAHAGYITVGNAPGTVRITERGRRRAIR
jgi:hypothetical protein